MASRKLSSLTEVELRKLISELCLANKDNKLFVESFLNKDSDKSFEDFKSKIDKALSYSYGRKGKSWSFKDAKHYLSTYKRFSNNLESIAELYVYTSEVGNEITMTLGDIDDGYYTTMENFFESACQRVCDLSQSNEKNTLISRLKKIEKRTKGIGWGYHDALEEIFEEYFSE